ncbi:MAG: glycine oxidase ThiO [Thermomicrobium sp.]|nr:glycine oxidase ThiO [Thermomicrobium sp.]MDW7982010.1 glycine oxidase ThiO [Thermomicrobium sp.]
MVQRLERHADVVVIGGGVIGATIAYGLSRRGLRVTLIERETIGDGASMASAGIVSPLDARHYPLELQQLLWQSLRSYPWLISTLQEETGLAVGYREWGTLLLAESEAEVVPLQELGRWFERHGFAVEWLDGPGTREAEPLVPIHIQGGLLLEQGASVLVPQLVRAAVLGAQHRGATVLEHTAVTALELSGERVTAVRTTHERLLAETVVLAAGAWSGQVLAPLGVSLPTLPVKGQMVLIDGSTRRPKHIIGGPGVTGYVVPRADGLVWVGTTVERGRWSLRPTAQGLWQCFDTARRLTPALLQEDLRAVGAGLRPGTPDDLPVLGRFPGWRNLWVAAGHFRLGVMLAPVTADRIVEAIELDREDGIPQRLSPSRFLDPAAGAAATEQ